MYLCLWCVVSHITRYKFSNLAWAMNPKHKLSSKTKVTKSNKNINNHVLKQNYFLDSCPLLVSIFFSILVSSVDTIAFFKNKIVKNKPFLIHIHNYIFSWLSHHNPPKTNCNWLGNRMTISTTTTHHPTNANLQVSS